MTNSPELSNQPMTVWLDYDLCTGCGLCAEIAPEVFCTGEDGYARVKQNGKLLEGGPEGLAVVEAQYEEPVRQAAKECPGQIIMLGRLLSAAEYQR